jgi:hypothetical protein
MSPWEATGSLASHEIPAFCGTRRFITIFTSPHHWSPSWDSWIQFTPPSCFFKNHFNIVPFLICAFSCWYCVLQCWCWVVCYSYSYVLWIHTFILYLIARVIGWSLAPNCEVDARITVLQSWKNIANRDIMLCHGSPSCFQVILCAGIQQCQ